MSGLIDAIMGGGDQTPDPNSGLTPADRAQAGFSGLGQIGALLMAAGQPMWGNERARVLSQLAGVPGNMQELQGQAVQRHLLAGKLQTEQRKNAAAKALQGMASDPSILAGLNPAQQAIMKSAFASGDMGTILQAQNSNLAASREAREAQQGQEHINLTKAQIEIARAKEAREAAQPLPLGYTGMFYDRQSNSAINPVTGVRIPLGANGLPNGQATYGSGAPVEEGDDEIDPVTGNREKWLAKQSQFLRDQLPHYANADWEIPSGSSRANGAQEIRNALAHYAPNLQGGDAKAKANAIKATSVGGDVFKTIIGPANKVQNHSVGLLDALDSPALGLGSDFVSVNGGNQLRMLAAARAARGSDAANALGALNTFREGVKEEIGKFMAGGGVLSDKGREAFNQLDSNNPDTVRGAVRALADLMKGQLDPVAAQYKKDLKKPSMKGEDFLDDKSRNNYQAVMQRTALGAAPAKPQAAAPAQASGAQPTAADIAYLQAHPEVADKFKARFPNYQP